ncbi:MAG TPA: endolytic transglycosylase MltG [Saprospiraceae bacterium]|nr:endolytic transglycosylase MltG [Saprospiraceae bacterium]HRO08406.1 endolytic transglycosylase MltG [Saprospiraceae bacterium]HRP41791.1 endolytic transglycosylase MltG [Saprospiraceae bacterium]
MSKILRAGLTIAVIAGLIGLYLFFHYFRSNNFKGSESKTIYIHSDATFDDVLQIMKDSNVLKDISTFRTVAQLRNYDTSVKPGKYILKPGMNNQQIAGKLRSGDQDPQKVTINNIRMISDLAGKASRYFESDSITFLNYLKDPEVAASLGYNQDNFLTMFIPNTYEMFWTSTPESFVKRMKKEYDNFWTQDRINKLTANNLTPTEAYIIASIVEKESNYTPEKPVIAGVYLNRLHAGERLQADPTVVFAMGDFSIQRVLYTHLKTDSPYNTYLNTGLPPGPICMPSMASLEAVINVDKHKYMFFCARPDNSGIHVFAETYQEHLKNADNFSKWLNSLNIK